MGDESVKPGSAEKAPPSRESLLRAVSTSLGGMGSRKVLGGDLGCVGDEGRGRRSRSKSRKGRSLAGPDDEASLESSKGGPPLPRGPRGGFLFGLSDELKGGLLKAPDGLLNGGGDLGLSRGS